MNTSRWITSIAILSGIVGLTACDTRNDSSSSPPIPSARTDRSAPEKTPMDQSQSSEDVKITAAIRRAIMEDKGMSMNAQNCVIVTDKSGLVTLRGVVISEAEKETIAAKAKAVAGVTSVDNRLEVHPR